MCAQRPQAARASSRPARCTACKHHVGVTLSSSSASPVVATHESVPASARLRHGRGHWACGGRIVHSERKRDHRPLAPRPRPRRRPSPPRHADAALPRPRPRGRGAPGAPSTDHNLTRSSPAVIRGTGALTEVPRTRRHTTPGAAAAQEALGRRRTMRIDRAVGSPLWRGAPRRCRRPAQAPAPAIRHVAHAMREAQLHTSRWPCGSGTAAGCGLVGGAAAGGGWTSRPRRSSHAHAATHSAYPRATGHALILAPRRSPIARRERPVQPSTIPTTSHRAKASQLQTLAWTPDNARGVGGLLQKGALHCHAAGLRR